MLDSNKTLQMPGDGIRLHESHLPDSVAFGRFDARNRDGGLNQELDGYSSVQYPTFR